MTMMITRTFLATLWWACASALSPIVPLNTVGDTSDCALYLNGPGRTSAYDYSINLLKGNFGYEGQTNCITYEAINQAYLEARNRILVSQPKGDWKAEHFASVGELILDISINLARRYGLTYEEIEKGLPLIDTSRTLIREVCPPVFSHVECRAGKYRRLDGLCNNLQHPTWGATMAPFQRLIGPLFSDGINAPRIAHHGKDLPLSRVVSRTMHPDEGFHDHAGTVMVIAWGQFMDHDYTLTATPLDPVNRNDPEECCKRPPHLKHPYCNEIRIPDDDYFYRLFGVKCIDFVRGFPSPRPGCRLGSRVPFNTLTGVIDGNTVYGVTEKFSRKLRTGFGGLLRMNPVFKEYGLKDLLPLKLDIPDEGCTRPNKNMYCFEAGEIRVNEQLVLTVMHTLMAREHNRVANALAEVNPHWDDETLFQEARRINIAEIQHITYNEFLPILLGKDVMEKFGLVLEKEGYWDGYDPEVNPDVIASFAAAAYRFGHSLLPTAVERWSKAHKFIASKRLSDLIRRPYDLYRAGVLDEYVMGLMNQVAQAMDDSITQEVTNHLFKKVGARFGMDLVSFNMQRGREFGLPGYMEFRKFCGLPAAETFQDLFGSMPNATVQKYETIFDHPIDVDLWSGGVSERPLPGSMLGPTFACIIATQFSYSRRGDRFWFELPNQPSSFTQEQLVEIRKARLARIICDNTDIIDTVQLYPMVLPDHELNPRVPCRSGIIPSMDFSKWAEPAPFHGSAKQFMTNATIVENNSTSHDEIERENCNQTISTNKETQNCDVNTQYDQNSDCSINTINNITNVRITKCNIPITNKFGQENNTAKNNQIADKNSVLKYVYKKGNKSEIPAKNTGHFKNSLKRRSRSANELQINSPLPSKFQKPAVIVNYETSHGPRDVESLLPVRNTGNEILKANLADFNIETLHDNSNIKREENVVRDIKNDSAEVENLNETSNEREDYKHTNSNKKSSPESEEIEEHEGNKIQNSNYENQNSGEYKDYKTQKSSRESDESGEHRDNKHEQSSREVDENAETKVSKNNKPNYKHDNDDSIEQVDYNKNKDYKNEEYNNEKKYNREREDYRNNKSSRERDESSEHQDYAKRQSSREIDESAESNFYENNKPSHGKDDSVEQADYKKSKSSHERDDSSERQNYKNNRNSANGNYNSAENTESNPRSNARYSSPKDDSIESSEVNEDRKSQLNNVESKESAETYDKDKYTSTRKPYDGSQKIIENVRHNQLDGPQRVNDFENKKTEVVPNKNFKSSSESSNEVNESIEDKTKLENYQTDPRNLPKKSLSVPIRDIDLNDFSYERININENGKVEPQKDDLEELDPNTAVEILPLTTAIPDTETKEHHTQNSLKDNHTLPKPIKESYENKLIHINDGEVKPVVEINTENYSGSSEENTKANLNNDDEVESLESILGVINPGNLNDDDQSDKIVAEKAVQNGDVKQQFERIPLNYNHDKKHPKKDSQTTEAPKQEDTEVTEIDGTLDAFAPEDVRYDEKLNIKFDDLSIKLPEIKLPDDIIAFTRESSPYSDENKKPKQDVPSFKPSYYYNHDDREETRKRKNKNNGDDIDDDDHAPETGYYGYYGDTEKKQNYKKKNAEAEEESEEEDLYEKFVRERFGKRGTFGKRSEKLQAEPLNPELYKTIKSILKKTADIDEQAKKSGDPNAGYMWTLEYGEKL